MLENITIRRISFLLLCMASKSALSAQSIDLSEQSVSFLRSLSSIPTNIHSSLKKPILTPEVKELSRSVDFNQTLHVRIQQTYAGFPIWGSDAVMHIPKGDQNAKSFQALLMQGEKSKASMNGLMYQNVQQDLQQTPRTIFQQPQMDKAWMVALNDYNNEKKEQVDIDRLQQKQSRLVVYIDDNDHAHWAYHVSFYMKENKRPVMPTYLIDAVSLKIYEKWNEIKSLTFDDVKQFDTVQGGGFGGNKKMGQIIYDGLKNHYPRLNIKRDAEKKVCYLANDEVTVTDFRTDAFVQFPCEITSQAYGGIYWDGEMDNINEAYSPSNDALFAGKVVKELYQSWYNIPVLKNKDNQPMMIEIVTHSPNYDKHGLSDPDNALWDPVEQRMYFGDGKDEFYPLTSLGVAAHEISHGFTQQNANLAYEKQSGGLNEAFSDMAAQAVEYFYFGTNSWKIGEEVKKEKYGALRYMDEPSRDCYQQPLPIQGINCSFDTLRDYDAYIMMHRQDFTDKFPNVHYSSGIFNRAFYLLATSSRWDVKKAFNVMVQANQNYWTQTTTFRQAACGVIKATKDYSYDIASVRKAFTSVGIDTGFCH